MSDLISRSALLEAFSKNSIYRKITNAEGKNVIEIIAEQPTAFDLGKVVAELNRDGSLYVEYNHAMSKDEIAESVYKQTKEQVIEIVKRAVWNESTDK